MERIKIEENTAVFETLTLIQNVIEQYRSPKQTKRDYDAICEQEPGVVSDVDTDSEEINKDKGKQSCYKAEYDGMYDPVTRRLYFAIRGHGDLHGIMLHFPLKKFEKLVSDVSTRNIPGVVCALFPGNSRVNTPRLTYKRVHGMNTPVGTIATPSIIVRKPHPFKRIMLDLFGLNFKSLRLIQMENKNHMKAFSDLTKIDFNSVNYPDICMDDNVIGLQKNIHDLELRLKFKLQFMLYSKGIEMKMNLNRKNEMKILGLCHKLMTLNESSYYYFDENTQSFIQQAKENSVCVIGNESIIPLSIKKIDVVETDFIVIECINNNVLYQLSNSGGMYNLFTIFV